MWLGKIRRHPADELLIHTLAPARGRTLPQPADATRHPGKIELVLIVGREHAVQTGVSDRHMVGLEVVVHGDLPVAVPVLDVHAPERAQVWETMRGHLAG